MFCYSFLIQVGADAYLCGVPQSRTLMEPWVQVSFNKPGFAGFQTELNLRVPGNPGRLGYVANEQERPGS